MNIEKISQIATFLPKSKIKAGEANEKGKYIFFTSSDTNHSYIDKYLYDDELVIIGTGGFASCNYYNGKFAVSTDNFVIKPNNNLLAKYLYYFLRKDNLFVLQNGFRGTGLKHISKEYVSNIAVPICALDKQKSIVGSLDAINDSIKNEEQCIIKFNELIKSRFNEMFGEVTELTPENGICLGKICKTIGGGTPSTKYPEFYKGDIPWISTVALGPNFIDGKNAKGFITEEAVEKSATHLIPKGSVMVGTRVGVGKCSINLIDMCTNQDINSIVELNENYNPLFIKYCLDCYQSYFDSIKKGTTILGITSDDLKKVLIPIIKINTQNQFVSFVQQVDKLKFKIKTNKNYIEYSLEILK